MITHGSPSLKRDEPETTSSLDTSESSIRAASRQIVNSPVEVPLSSEPQANINRESDSSEMKQYEEPPDIPNLNETNSGDESFDQLKSRLRAEPGVTWFLILSRAFNEDTAARLIKRLDLKNS